MTRRKTPSSARPQSTHHEHGLPALKPLRVLVAGEVILDRYLWGDVARISPEAPIPILRVQRREENPSPLKPARERELIARVRSELRNCDGVLISDIDKGMLTRAVLRALIDG